MVGAAPKKKRRGKTPTKSGADRPELKQATTSQRARARGARFPGLRKGQGYGVAIHLVDAMGVSPDRADRRMEWIFADKKRVGAAKGRPPRLGAKNCHAIAAVGHPVRAAILWKLLEGPATYQALRRVTKLEPGPFFFHVGQLRISGLIMPKQRDLYELTRGGRNLVLTLMAIVPLVRDRRRCPVPR